MLVLGLPVQYRCRAPQHCVRLAKKGNGKVEVGYASFTSSALVVCMFSLLSEAN